MAVIHQLSISDEAHAFFSLLDKQISIDGDIFDPPPAFIRGNMINLDNQEENVIGYFFASDAAIDTIFIKRDELDELQITRQINDDCRVINAASTEKPDFWD
jgi:surface polysaccharide O-acyltransferase-like enzyme